MSASRRALRIRPEHIDRTRAERDARSLRDDLRRLGGTGPDEARVLQEWSKTVSR